MKSRRLRSLVRGCQLNRELNAEVRFHIEMETEEYVRQGMDRDAARRQAFRNFGPMEKHKEETRDARGTSHVEHIVQDVQYALRTLRKAPGFSALAIFTLAVGIGANATIFSIVNAAFFAPYQLREAARLLRIYGDDRQRSSPQISMSVPRFRFFREQQTSFTSLAAANYNGFTLDGSGDAVQVPGAWVTSDFLDTFGATPLVGRFFTRAEEEIATVAVLGEDLWRTRFGADPQILGRTITLSGDVFTVVGVAPRLPAFWDADVWLTTPFQFPGVSRDLLQRGYSFLAVAGRLKPDVSQTQAARELEVLAGRYREANSGAADAAWAVTTVPLRDDIVGASRSSILTLLAAVGLLLVVACANVANLLLVRFTGRRQEIGLRTALGASRGRIVRQFLAESLLLSGLGAAAGAALAYWALPALLTLSANNLAFSSEIRLNIPVLLATAGLALVSGLVMGAYPALQGSRADIVTVLRDGGRTIAGALASHRARHVIVAAQVAVSMVLLVGAALLVTSFIKLRGQPAGFDARNVFVAGMTLPPARYPDPASQDQFYFRLADALAAAPGVTRATLAQSVPLGGPFLRAPYAPAEGAVPPLNERPLGLTQSLTAGYFATMGIPILAGRDFSERDREESPLVGIVSQAAARKLFPGETVLGRRIIMGSTGGGQELEIVGVAADVRTQTLAGIPDVEFYRPVTQRPRTFMQMVVRTAGDPAAFATTARRLVAEIDPTLPVTGVTTLAEVVDQSLAQQRLLFTLLAAFAAMAVTLSAVGIYGVVAFFVGQRTAEIGVRIALGAHASEVVGLVMKQSLAPVAAGVLLGLAASAGLGRFVQSLLFEVSALDSRMLVGSAVVIAAAAIVACGLPARRAAQINPVVALRGE